MQAVWAPKGQTPQVRLDLRNDSIGVYGSLDLRTGQVVATPAARMNSAATIAHLRDLLNAYPGRGILLFWDRAPWHTSAAVQLFLQRHWRIEVVYFPVGAPDCNPQEHVWKAELTTAFLHELTTCTFPSSFFAKYGGTVICPFLE